MPSISNHCLNSAHSISVAIISDVMGIGRSRWAIAPSSGENSATIKVLLTLQVLFLA